MLSNSNSVKRKLRLTDIQSISRTIPLKYERNYTTTNKEKRTKIDNKIYMYIWMRKISSRTNNKWKKAKVILIWNCWDEDFIDRINKNETKRIEIKRLSFSIELVTIINA